MRATIDLLHLASTSTAKRYNAGGKGPELSNVAPSMQPLCRMLVTYQAVVKEWTVVSRSTPRVPVPHELVTYVNMIETPESYASRATAI